MNFIFSSRRDMMSYEDVEEFIIPCTCNGDFTSVCATRIETLVNVCNTEAKKTSQPSMALPINSQVGDAAVLKPCVTYQPSSRLNFHIYESSEIDSITSDFAGFTVEAAIRIKNKFLFFGYNEYRNTLVEKLGAEGDNVKTMYHTTKGNVFHILQNGLDVKKSRPGFFGNALYFSDTPLKANDYSPLRGYAGTLRVMLRCKVALGRTHPFRIGSFNQTLKTAPAGSDSVSGFIRKADEYAVYRNDAVYVSELVFYRVQDLKVETTTLVIPNGVPKSSCVFITANLSMFFSKLTNMCVSSEQEKAMRRLIGNVLKKVVTVEDFTRQIRLLLGANPTPSPTFNSRLQTELRKVVAP